MGISLVEYRSRIGRFKATCRSSTSSQECCTLNLTLRHLPVAALAILLLISGIELNPGPVFYCQICKCSFASAKDYYGHSRLHLSDKRKTVLCPFEGCGMQVSSFNSFKIHKTRYHREPKVPVTFTGLSCAVATCDVKIISRDHYLTHMVNDHLKNEVTFECLYLGCTTMCTKVKQFRTHVSRSHPKYESSLLPPISSQASVSSLNDQVPAFDSPEDDFPFPTDYDSEFSDEDLAMELDGEVNEDNDLYPYNVVKDELAKFYLKLEAVKLLPTTTVQDIADEIKIMTEMSHHHLKKALRQELEKINLNKDVMDCIVRQTFRSDPVFNVHHKNEDLQHLGTHHLRSQFRKSRFPFVEPKRVYLGPDGSGKKRYAHHMSIRESLDILLRDEEVKTLVLKSFSRSKSADILQDYYDGLAYDNHKKSHEGEKCLQILLFQDAFDPSAFGPAAGQYKPVGFYYSLGNLPADYRSRVDLIQMVYMILEKDMKSSQEDELADKDTMKELLKPLLDDLLDLERNGIVVDGENVRVCVLYCLGDSLGQNTIGGYVKNFSSCEFSCRFCSMSKTEFLKNPYDTKPLRTPEEYDSYVDIAKKKWCHKRQKALQARKRAKEMAMRRGNRVASRCSAPAKKTSMTESISKSAYKNLISINFKGVKYRPSPLNSKELNFHVCSPGQPPCLAHDLFEGVVKKVLAQILKYFIETKDWFDLTCLNRRIKSFKCQGSDVRDAPTPLKNLDSLSGNASENWNLLRLLPFIIGDLVIDKEDEMWKLFLSLKEICEYVCAPKISMSQVAYLKSIIREYLVNIQLHLPSSLTPKHHYLCHYPELIFLFGPLIRLFTLRFESKHAFFKAVVKSCRNYINLTYTLARKYACRFAYDHIGNVLPPDLIYNEDSSRSFYESSLSEEMKVALPVDFDFNDYEVLGKVTVSGIEYRDGLCMVVENHRCDLLVGLIKIILLQKSSGKVLFLLEQKPAVNTFSGYYTVQRVSSYSTFSLKYLRDMPDYYPLPLYSFSGQDCLTLKHSIIPTM